MGPGFFPSSATATGLLSMLPSVGRGARYFLLGLALPTFLSLLHLNLKASPRCTNKIPPLLFLPHCSLVTVAWSLYLVTVARGCTGGGLLAVLHINVGSN